MKQLSIITINYNNEKGLKNTIDSVVSQTFKDFEFIIIDGNSNDDSVNHILAAEEKITFWLSENDAGIYNAMNKGINKAKGEYLLFLNSGDSLNGINALHNFINHKGFFGDIIYGDYKFDIGEKIFPNNLTPLFFIKSSLPHQSTFIKKSIFKEMGNYNEQYSIASDREFFIKCFLSEKYKFKHINILLTSFDLLGISNNPEYATIKEKEDREILESNFGIYYKDYKHLLLLEKKINEFKRKTFRGIFKRIITKIKTYAKA